MSITTVESTIDRRYLRNRTKDEVIEHVMRLLDENDHLEDVLREIVEITNPRVHMTETMPVGFHWPFINRNGGAEVGMYDAEDCPSLAMYLTREGR